MPNVKKIRGLKLPGTPWGTSACCGRPLPFTVIRGDPRPVSIEADCWVNNQGTIFSRGCRNSIFIFFLPGLLVPLKIYICIHKQSRNIQAICTFKSLGIRAHLCLIAPSPSIARSTSGGTVRYLNLIRCVQ